MEKAILAIILIATIAASTSLVFATNALNREDVGA
jgi:hypothetical protein